ncbi:MAG: PAS domain-containing protein [Bacteroidetes bacterium]|nr:PAS domain-containing protein [Bacteroidota bacterium]
MDLKEAARQKTFTAEKQISYVRMIVILFGTVTFFFLNHPHVHTPLAHFLLILIWLYGLYIPIFKPYKKYSIFLASWFTYLSDSIFATLWIYATGGFYSPYHVMFYISIIAVAFRFDLKTTFFTSALYTLCYFILLWQLNQLADNETEATVRTGFIFIIGFMTYLITQETLNQTQQKIAIEQMAEEVKENYTQLSSSQAQLTLVNQKLILRNAIFNHAEENALIGSYAWYLASNKLEYSDNLYKLLGCEVDEFEPSFEKYMTFVHPDDRATMLTNWEEYLRSKKIKNSRYRIYTKSGKLKYLHSSGKITGPENDTLVIGTVQDITSDVEMHELIHQKNKELEKSNTELASFNYIASHDLQEPVRKIHTFSKLILEKDTDLNDKTRGYLSRISSSAIRMQNLIVAFLNYSRVENTPLAFEKTDMNVLMDEVIANLSDLMEEKNAVIKKTQLPVVMLLPFQIQQLFINLISNSIKYSKPDVSPVIKISCAEIPGSQIEQEGVNANINYWKINVEDNGIGFDQKYADKIFEVFQRLHNKDEYAGTGIGLAICKKIVNSHKGFITATGSYANGATFSIYLPVA